MPMGDNNLELQADEVTALVSIYGSDMSEFDASKGTFTVTINGNNARQECSTVELRITLPPQYPSDSPPIFELHAPWLRGDTRRALESSLIAVYRDNAGCPVVYAWAEAIRQFLESQAGSGTLVCEPVAPAPVALPDTVDTVAASAFLHGELIEDRRSVFQAHLLAPVRSADEATLGVASLIASERKIASATHNIWAYRIERTNTNKAVSSASFLTDCDDDGESQAGGRLLRMLELADVRNAVVVVSRWYGGVLLGPDRFKHINNAARQLLEANGLVQPKRRH